MTASRSKYDVLIAGGEVGIAQLIDKGRFETIDLSRLGYERVQKNAPYPERGIL